MLNELKKKPCLLCMLFTTMIRILIIKKDVINLLVLFMIGIWHLLLWHDDADMVIILSESCPKRHIMVASHNADYNF